MNENPRVLGNRYEVGDLLGRGGMAEVHLGRDTRLGRVVAIKLLRTDLARDPTFQARFRREAQSAAALNHPAIVAVYDTGEEPVMDSGGAYVPLPYIVMEHVQGRTLRDLIEQARSRASSDLPYESQPPAGALDVDFALEVTSGVLSALEYSHRAGIVHRDIKPANVMVTPTGDVKVMDFGIARALADASATMTQTHAVIGTAQYLSPEQARGEAVDARSDLYSTGCLLFELLTGRPPFVADSPVAVAYQHVREFPVPPSSLNPRVPEAVDRIVMHSLTKDRDIRYQSAGEFRGDIEAARVGRRVAAPVVGAAPAGVVGPTTAATEFYAPGGPAMVAPAATRAMPSPTATVASGPPTSGFGTMLPGAPETGSYAGYVPTRRADRRSDGDRGSRGLGWAIAAIVLLALLGVGAFAVGQLMRDNTGGTVVKVTVPPVTGLVQADAESAIKAAGLVPKVVRAASNTVDEGRVISQSPVADNSVDRGSTVTITVSTGADTVTIPNLAGKTQDEARQALEALRLSVGQVIQEDNSPYDVGIVIRTDPAAKIDAAPGDTVDLIVSSGNVVMPDVTGKTEADARKVLTGLGLRVRKITQESTEKPGTVIDQDTRAGLKLSRGDEVTITVAIAPAPTPTPTPTETPTPTPTTT